jgi:hypothetical protein
MQEREKIVATVNDEPYKIKDVIDQTMSDISNLLMNSKLTNEDINKFLDTIWIMAKEASAYDGSWEE